MILGNEGAQVRGYQYYVTICLSTKQFLQAPHLPSHHGSLECYYDDQPEQKTLFAMYLDLLHSIR